MRRRHLFALPPCRRPGRPGRPGRLRALRVLLVAQQLRRSAPGGIGTYVRGLAGGLSRGPRAYGSGEAGGSAGAGLSGDAGADGSREAGGSAGAGAGDPESAGHAVSLLASRSPKSPDPLDELGLPVRVSPLPAQVLTRAWHAGLLSAPRGFDVVHATSFNAPRSSAPLTMAVHDLAWRVVPETFPIRGRRWHDAALAKAIRRATMLIVPSQGAADHLVAAGAGAGQVEVLDPMYGCDHLPPPDDAGAVALLARLGVTGPYLLSVGTLEPRKNLARLMEAYSRARPSLPEPWPLVVVGPRGWGEALGSEPPDGVLLAGGVGDGVLSALYAGARAVAYVPLHEGFGLPAVEAMAAGAPVVATPMPSTGGAALEVGPLDVVAMAGALVQAATDEGCRAQLIAAGQARAAQLTWAAVAARHLQLWEGLAQR